MNAQSYKVEVNTYGDPSDTWTSNALRFDTYADAQTYGANLAQRWTAVRKWRTVTSTDPVTETED